MGVVHLARDASGRRVALKVLRPHVVGDDEARARLAREVNSLGRIRSVRVAEIVDADPWGDIPFVATRYVPGLSLHDHVREEGTVRGADLRWFAHCLGQALQAVHAVGVLHRDIKPSNVLMEGRAPVLIDFGLARLADDPKLTHTGWLMGTPGYLAPEILFGDEATTASDVHAWAATVAYAATGRSPFGRGPAMAIMDRVRRGEHDLDGVEGDVRRALEAALDPEPGNRPTLDHLVARFAPDGAPAVAAPAPPEPTALRPEVLTMPFAAVAARAADAPTGRVVDAPVPTRVETVPTTPASTTAPPLLPPVHEPYEQPPPVPAPAQRFHPLPPARTAPPTGPTRAAPVAYAPLAPRPGPAHDPWAERGTWPPPAPGEGVPGHPGRGPAPQALPPQPLAARLRRAVLLVLLAGLVGAVVSVVPWLAVGGLVLLVWALRTASLVGSAADVRRRRRGRGAWYDPFLALVLSPVHVAVGLAGTLLLALWSALVGAAALLLAYGLGGGTPGALLAGGLGLALGIWTGPGSTRVRRPLDRVLRPVSAGVGPWVAASFVVGCLVVGCGAIGLGGGADWTPAEDRPFRSVDPAAQLSFR